MILKTILLRNLYNYKLNNDNCSESILDLVISCISTIGFLSIDINANDLHKDIQVKEGTTNFLIHFI
jgi:hypothetical protein